MEIIIVILIIIILLLGGYLFFFSRELRRMQKELDMVLSRKTNGLVHVNYANKEVKQLVKCINNHISNIKSRESELERKNDSFIKMVRNITHDLRTPLTSALGYVDMILSGDMPAQKKISDLHVVEERLKRLSDLIDEFFEFSKIIATDKIELDKINVVGVLEQAIANHYEDFSNDSRKIEFNRSNRDIVINSNSLMLLRIFDNLIRNAYKHSKSDLIIDLDVSKDKINISFMNLLIVSEIDIDQIFDEFYTVDVARTSGNTGLGLAIAKEFTEELGGVIAAKKKEGKLTILVTFDI